MRTQIMGDTKNPWLEFYPPDGSHPETIKLEQWPFTVGRNEEADHTISSGKVSREHAEFSRRGPLFFLKDLGSTNGTFVNGDKIDEVQLNDGDVVVIADVEFNFFTGEEQTGTATVTQVMDGDTTAAAPTRPDGVVVDPAQEFILGVRRLHQSVTHRCISCFFEPIASLENDEVFGYEIHPVLDRDGWLGGPRQMRSAECRLNERINQLARNFAAESSSRLPDEAYLFFNVEPSEVGVEWLPESLSRLQETVSEYHHVVVEIPDTAVCDIPYFRDFLHRLKQRDILTAYDGFAGGVKQVKELGNIVPDFLKLSHTLVRGIDRSSGGQRQVQALVHECESLGCRAIATGVDDHGTSEVFRELGCELAQGEFIGVPQPLERLVKAASLV